MDIRWIGTIALHPVNRYMQAQTKVVFSRAMERTGILGLLRRVISTHNGLILALHRVLPSEERSLCYNPHVVLSEPTFISLLQFLRQDYQVVHLQDLLANPSGSNGRPKVAITFDDGWEDNYRIAFPHLLTYQIPATIFVCTELLDTTGVLPEERFARLWNQCASRSCESSLADDLNHWGIGKSKNLHMGPSQQYWAQELKRMPLDARLLLLDHLEQRYEISAVTTRRFLRWEELRTMMHTDLIRLGSHTSRHATLSSEADRDIRRELEDSRASLWEHTGIVPEILAYPNGMHNRRVLDLVRSVGFKAALATHPGLVNRHSNPLSISRISIDDTTVSNADLQFSPSQTSVYFLNSWIRSAASF